MDEEMMEQLFDNEMDTEEMAEWFQGALMDAFKRGCRVGYNQGYGDGVDRIESSITRL